MIKKNGVIILMKIGLKMKEITKATGVNNSTILYYLSIGLLPKPVKTSKNMAYYPDIYLRIIPVVLYLKENMHLPLEIIKQIIENIGFENISKENVLHYYKTFLEPYKNVYDQDDYDKEISALNINLTDNEIVELERRKMLFPSAEGLLNNEDLMAAKAYKTLQGFGVSFLSLERLVTVIDKLMNEVHEIYHECEHEMNLDEELEFTKVLHKEIGILFRYLMSKKMQEIYQNEQIASS